MPDEENDQDQAVPRRWGGLAWRVVLVVVIVAAIGGAAGAVYETNRTNGPAGPKPATIATAVVRGVNVYDHAGSAKPAQTLANPNRQGAPLTFLVQQKRTGWLRVLLPVRPNGSAGWIHASDVRLTTTAYRIDVSLSGHKMVLHKGARTIMTRPVATGAAKTPTPAGRFFVTVLLRPMNPKGEYGPYAFGLSAYSAVLFHFGGGPGQVGLHGTNNPAALGRSVSSGCVRVSNDTVTHLAKIIPLGTPVTISR